jgi:glycosyltransferase involved in cell wall biosynthesis
MPVYNAEPYLYDAIDSILNQTFHNFEFLIINDGSTDNSEKIILSYKDSRIRYIKNETNIKLIETLNKGIENARGKYIARMDADDISLPNRLEKQYAFLENHPEIGIVGTWFESFNEKGVIGISKYNTKHQEICFKQLYQINLCHGTCMIRKEILDEHDLNFNPEYIHAEDYDLFTRMSKLTKLANLEFVGYKVRHHANEVSNKYATIQIENSTKIKKREFNLIGIPISNELIDDFTNLNHQNYKSIQNIDEMRNLLESLVAENKKSHYFNSTFLETQISSLWFHYCYNTKQKKLFYSSFLSTHKSIGLTNKIKILIKG